MGADLFHFEEVGQRRFSFRFHFGQLHCAGEIVYETAVNVQHDRFAERTNKHVAQTLVTVPITNTIGQSNAKQGVTLKNFG